MVFEEELWGRRPQLAMGEAEGDGGGGTYHSGSGGVGMGGGLGDISRAVEGRTRGE